MASRRHIHWVWLPAAVLYNVGVFVRYGVVWFLVGLALGLGLIGLGEYQAAKRRRSS